MRVRRILAVIIGLAQGGIGALTVTLAFILNFNLLGVQKMLNIPEDLLPLYLLIFGAFGSFSVISGFFLIHEWLE